MRIARPTLLLAVVSWAILCAAASSRADPQPIRVRRDVDFAALLDRCDMVWDHMPARWEDGAFVGNGLVGAMVFRDDGGGVRFEVGRTDVFDHRPVPDGPHPNVGQYLHCRLPTGYFLLKPAGRVTACHLRLKLFDAELTGRITTDAGDIDLRLLAPAAGRNTILLDAVPTAGERAFTLTWHAYPSESPRLTFGLKYRLKSHHLSEAQWRQAERVVDYRPNPPPTTGQAGPVQWSSQPMTAGGAYVTAWRDDATATGRNCTWAVGYSTADEPAARADAVAALVPGTADRRAAAVDAHRQWWHAFWPASFIDVPDDRLSQFYWLQQYKMGSATRAGRPMLDLYGPWLRSTAWPYYCWNMNVQVAYSPMCAANRLDLGENLTAFLFDHEPALRANAGRPDAAALGRATGQDAVGALEDEWGDLPWALHDVYRQLRFAGDDARLTGRFYPLLRQSMNVYLGALQKDDQGVLHLPPTVSPEYGVAPDCNYDLSLLRWGLGVLLTYADRAHATAEDRGHWADVLQHLTPYPTDADGLLIGRGVPLAHAHRHFSHLLMVYPLRTMDADADADRRLIRTSLDHWMNVPGGDRLGFTFVGAASIAAVLGDGDRSLAMLDALLDRTVHPNTMYVEGCIESPLGLCDALQNMYLSSDDRRVAVFPAVPAAWGDAAFDDLRAQGAFLVSARRSGGRTRWVRVKSLRGEPLVIRPGLAGDVRTQTDDPGLDVRRDRDDFAIRLSEGKSVVLYVGDGPPDLTVTATPTGPGRANLYGDHAGHARSLP